MKIELDKEQRDAVHQMIRLRLQQIDAIPLLLDRNDPGLAREEWVADSLLLALLDEIGWSRDDAGHTFPVEMPEGDLARCLKLVRDQALSVLELAAEDRLNARTHGEEPALIALRAAEEASGEGWHP